MFDRITSRTNRISSGSIAYSRLRWKPRRATFSVRIDRRRISTVKPCAMRDGDQQRQQHVDVVRQLEREDDAGERRAHRAAEDRAHADERPEARRPRRAGTMRLERRPARHPSSAAARARRPRCRSRARPPRSTDLTIRMPRISAAGDVALQQRPDGVVADAERLRKDQPADADHEPADRRPPHPVDRQPLERILGRVDR